MQDAFEATNIWTRRVRIGKASVEREMSAARKSDLELSGKPVKDNTRSSRCGCNAMIRLLSTWYKSSSPTILVMDGHKLKYQFSLGGAMFHNGMEAWVRGFNEREKKMFDRVGLPVSRGLLSRMYLHMENTWNREAPSMLRSLMSTSSLGYALRLCRMIMVPIAFDRDWCFGESPGYIAYYADNFNGTRLEEDIPRAGLASRRKRMLYETLAAQCNTAPRAGFMV
ncbi:hypothetical protein ZWY2020_052091 [Hordeum vulgare]|nr:hypothetical protein ZWY2020_052091 [Hordeum vulgare]